MEKCRTYKDGSKGQHVFTSCQSRNLWDFSFFSFRGSGKPYTFSSRLLYNVLLCLYAVLGRNSQNKANGISIHVVLRSGAKIWSSRRLSGYELDEN